MLVNKTIKYYNLVLCFCSEGKWNILFSILFYSCLQLIIFGCLNAREWASEFMIYVVCILKILNVLILIQKGWDANILNFKHFICLFSHIRGLLKRLDRLQLAPIPLPANFWMLYLIQKNKKLFCTTDNALWYCEW